MSKSLKTPMTRVPALCEPPGDLLQRPVVGGPDLGSFRIKRFEGVDVNSLNPSDKRPKSFGFVSPLFGCQQLRLLHSPRHWPVATQ